MLKNDPHGATRHVPEVCRRRGVPKHFEYFRSRPVISFDHEEDEWTVPLNLNFGKTVIWNGRPWKLSAEVNYYVDSPDAFGPEWFIGFNIAPVVENVLARYF